MFRRKVRDWSQNTYIKYVLLGLFITSTPPLSATSFVSKLGFHELKFRDQWDRGCEDWPVEMPVVDKSANPAFFFERTDLSYRLLGSAIFKPELGEELSVARARLESVLMDFAKYPDWILPKINSHPEKGGSYFVELNGLETSYLNLPSHALLTGPFEFNVATISLKSRTTIEVQSVQEGLPKCPFFKKSKGKSQVWRFRMIPRPDILEWLIGELYVVEHESSFEIRARIRLKPSRIIYELLPTKVIESELKLRGRQVMYNLIEARRQLAWKRGGSLLPDAPLKIKVEN